MKKLLFLIFFLPANLFASSLIDDASINFRYRIGYFEQSFKAEHGIASTLKTTVSANKKFNDIYFNLAARNVAIIGPENFNTSFNGKDRYPTELDPENTDIEEFLFYNNSYLPVTEIFLGRQKFEWDNGRFISSEPWRQSPRTYDGLRIESNYFPNLYLKYAYFKNINREVSRESPDGHYNGTFNLLNAKYVLDDSLGTLLFYAYFLNNKSEFVSNESNKTYGLNWQGETRFSSFSDFFFVKDSFSDVINNLKISYDLELAIQEDLGRKAYNYEKHYIRVEPTIHFRDFSLNIGYEIISGDYTNVFSTYLGNNHEFNGWIDAFNPMPVKGLKDFYIGTKLKLPSSFSYLSDARLELAFHNFVSYKGSSAYGNEIDAAISKKFDDIFTVTFKYAEFFDNSFIGNTQKYWLMFESHF